MKKLTSHWDSIYSTQQTTTCSWWQEYPQPSIELIRELRLDKSSPIIDVGGGDSKLVDCLLGDGYTDITVLDISSSALDSARHRLGERSELVKWIISDITTFHPSSRYMLWHDRAAFHFLIDDDKISRYRTIAEDAISEDGYLILGTFSTQGPKSCSGLPVHRYNPETLHRCFRDSFSERKSIEVDHLTPSGKIQNFLFSCFQKNRLSRG